MTLRIAVGSTRGPKVRAVERAVVLAREQFPRFGEGALEILAYDVPSETAVTPLTTVQLMQGARTRAQAAFALAESEGRRPALAIGLEGGVLRELEPSAHLPLGTALSPAGRGGGVPATHKEMTPQRLIQEKPEAAFLESWAYATDGARGFFGSSGCAPLPDALADAVLARGEDLGDAADRRYGLTNVASAQGTFGVLTGDMVTREEAFVRALLHALAPFYNPSAY